MKFQPQTVWRFRDSHDVAFRVIWSDYSESAQVFKLTIAWINIGLRHPDLEMNIYQGIQITKANAENFVPYVREQMLAQFATQEIKNIRINEN
jgi:hypothetical protein